MLKNLPANAGHKRCEFDPWVGKIPCRRKWQPIPAFLPGESHGQRSLAGYSPWGHIELDTTEAPLHAALIDFKMIATICFYFNIVNTSGI